MIPPRRSRSAGLVVLAAVLTTLQPGLAQPRRTSPGSAMRPPSQPAPTPPPARQTPSPAAGDTHAAAGDSAEAAHVGQEPPDRPTVDTVQRKRLPAPGLAGMVDTDGKATRQMTPGGVYRLVGSTFGDAKGQVRLLSPRWPGGVEYLTVLSWTDGEVRVAVPSDITAQPDFPVPGDPRDTLTLQLTTAAGEIYTLAPDPNFYAARQRISRIPSLLPDLIDVSGADPSWPLTVGHYTAAKGVYRYKSGSDIGCPNPGRDLIRLTLHNNWTLTGYLPESGTTVFGSATQDAHYSDGSTNFTGPRFLGGDPITRAVPGTQTHIVEFTIDWGVYRSHHSGAMTDDSKRDECTSQYFLMIGLEGPLDTTPLRDWSDVAPPP